MLGSRPQSQKTTHGTITKLFEKFGYVNDDIFFVRNLVTGGQPRVGDHVSVVADHTPGKAAKWTARSVRIESRHRSSGSQASGRRDRGDSSHRSSAPSVAHAASVPHRVLGLPELSVMELRQRYPRLHPPSDLFHVTNGWSAAFPIGSPIRLGCRTVNYHVFPREVDPLTLDEWSVLTGNSDAPVLEPQDQDYRYSAKVMLLSCPSLAELYRQTCSLAQAAADSRFRCIGLANALSFLCGFVSSGDSKSAPPDPLALGGPWSPSVDGEDVEGDPMVLVNTAIRHARRLAGVDLSGCSTWYKFMELHYYREPRRSSSSDSSQQQARLETVTYFLPDVWTAVPDAEQWGRLTEIIGQRVDALIYPPPPPPPPPPKEDEQGQPAADDADASSAPAETENAGDDGKSESADASATAATAEDSEADTSAAGSASQLSNLQAMKVADLRRELESRGRDSRGLKAQLVARLEEVLREEAEAKEADPEKPGDAAAETSENDDAKESGEKPRVSPLSDREQDRIRRHHRLPDTPALPAWPSRTAKGGRLRLESASLSQLLSNRLDSGGRESAFEVALFCEQFHEMLVRDCAYNICTALADCEQNEGEAGTTGAATSADDGSETQRKRPRLDSSAAADAGADEAATGLTRTIRPALLQACEFFDRDRTGQLASRDIEELVLSLGLLHSRSQIRRWVDKASGTEGASSLRYRRLTDRAVTAAEADAGYTAESAAQESGDSRPAPSVFQRAGGCPPVPADGGGGQARLRLRLLRSAEATLAAVSARERLCRDEIPLAASGLEEADNRRREAETETVELKERVETLTQETAEHKRGYAEYRQLLRDALDAVNAARQPFVDLFEAERLAIEEARKQREAEAAAAEAAKAAAAEAEKAAAAEAGDGEADNSDSVKPDEAEISEVEGGKEWAVVDAV
ncbi:hypothetical protein BOX15_Mlig015350g3 [Macrostomum lignano]|uniref:SAP domain-containing protein n=2 Tax=Macrostomum lignano TaxID=282301 RepID=A0A267ESM8_9PLAT|nr:hypothetical protein BOX15_Mlig015350g3 [Macrostomum lignano]